MTVRGLAAGLLLAGALIYAARVLDVSPGLAIAGFGGIAVANAVGAVQVARWERDHGGRLLVADRTTALDDSRYCRSLF